MIKNTATINFYQLRSVNGHSIEEIDLKKTLKDFAEVGFRKMTYRNNVIFISNLKKENSYYLGAIYSVQMGRIPPSMDIENDGIEALGLNDSQGLAKVGAFLIEPQANVFLLEAGGGVSQSLFANYISYTCQKPKFKPAVLMNPEEMVKFDMMGEFFKFSIDTAVPNDPSQFTGADGDTTIEDVVKTAQATNCDHILFTIDISPENRKRKKSLQQKFVRSFVRKFDRLGNDNINKLSVSGLLEGSDKIESVELVSKRLHGSITYEIEERLISDLNLKQRLEEMEKLYLKHRNAVLSAYTVDEKVI